MKKLKYSLSILTCIICVFIWSCSTQQKVNMSGNKTKGVSSEEGKYIVTAPVVYKSFVKKNGAVTEQQEMYLQRSIQDYYIKFCESKVSREALENHLSKMDDFMKMVTVEVEFRNGSGDICNDNIEQQSRMGEYVIIHRIVS